MSSSTKDTLQSYFDELLSIEPVAAESAAVESKPAPKQAAHSVSNHAAERVVRHKEKPTSERIPAPAPPALKRSVAAPTLSPPETDEAHALEAQQKAKLQALLDQHSLKLPPALTEEVKAAPVKVEMPLPVEPGSLATPEEPEVQVEAEAPEAEHELAQRFHSADSVCRWAENGRPQWAQSRFEALLFEVSGLTLAVPLVSLGQIVPLSEELTPIFGQSDWFMGILPTPHGRLRIVNTALFVMPEKYDASFAARAGYAISLDGVPWALAVDKVNQPISLEPEEIRWRSERTRRPWLAGTVKSAMCALLDIPRMAELLNESDPGLNGEVKTP